MALCEVQYHAACNQELAFTPTPTPPKAQAAQASHRCVGSWDGWVPAQASHPCLAGSKAMTQPAGVRYAEATFAVHLAV
ncbi:hypothetical protein O9K51_04241 [Purpureocillium lavendulum]|uniref:Uncharacterized protein n=1 Tax=Purpureocillium lavendulum TaxID=1247861 RepID=A0AB34FVB3_9HYPO|nr:hypothetical protein O9K51_04241 [Purpureocillium lavendulum]